MRGRGQISALLAFILVAGCAGSGASATSSTTAGTATLAPASPAVTMAPSQGASPSPTKLFAPSPSAAVFDPSTARWTTIGKIGAGPSDGELVGFDEGYVTVGSRDPFEEPIALFSKDGLGWEIGSLAKLVPNCPGWGPAGDEDVPDADTAAIATNGHEVVVVGAEQPHDQAGCADVGASIRPIAWLSKDGRTWRRSEPFYTGGSNGRATAVWAVRGGWQAVAEAPVTGTASIWQSADGLHWRVVDDLAIVGLTSVAAEAAGRGTVVIAGEGGTEGSTRPRLSVSRDGEAWTPIDKAGGCESGATQIVAPAEPGLDAWVIVSGTRICTSADLVHWASQEFPMSVWRVGQTRIGAIAIGDTCYGAGTNCPDPGPEAYLTADGVTWSRLEHPKAYYGRSLADGPAGVLLIGSGPDDDGVGVWQLEAVDQP